MQLSTLILISLQYLTFKSLRLRYFAFCCVPGGRVWESLSFIMVKSPPPSIRIDPSSCPHLDGPLPPGEGDLGSLRPLGPPQLVLVVDDLHDDQADAAHYARAHQYEHLRGEASINNVCAY